MCNPQTEGAVLRVSCTCVIARRGGQDGNYIPAYLQGPLVFGGMHARFARVGIATTTEFVEGRDRYEARSVMDFFMFVASY